MTKYIQISGWNNFTSSKQKQIHEWIEQILNARLATQNLLELMSQNNSICDSSATEFLQTLKNSIDNNFEVSDKILEKTLIRDDLTLSRTDLDITSESELKKARTDNTEDFCEMITVIVCGTNDTNCHNEVKRICQGNK